MDSLQGTDHPPSEKLFTHTCGASVVYVEVIWLAELSDSLIFRPFCSVRGDHRKMKEEDGYNWDNWDDGVHIWWMLI